MGSMILMEVGAGSNEAVEAAKTVLSGITSTLNVGTVAAVIGAGIGTGALLFLAWFGVRKLVSIITNGMRGKLKV